MLPLSEKFVLFGKVGTFSRTVNIDLTSGGTSYSLNETKWVPLLSIGAAYRFTPAMSVRAEYEYFGKKIIGAGDGSLKLSNQLWSISANYRF